MEQTLKERLVGAAVLVTLAVIFIPVILNYESGTENEITKTNIPPRPEKDFSSRIIPIQEAETVVVPALTEKEKTTAVEKIDTAETVAVVTKEIKSTKQFVVQEDLKNRVGINAWVVQLGSFDSETNAEKLNKKLRSVGYAAFVEPLKQKTKVVYRVRVGPELKRSDANALRDKINKKMKLNGIVVSYP